MDEEGIVYLALSFVIIFIAIVELPTFGKGEYFLSALVIIISGIVALLIFNFADYIAFPLVTILFGITFQPAAGYKIVKGQDTVLKEVGGLFYATGYITSNLFPYSFKKEEGTDENVLQTKLLTAPENWERAIISIGFPFKFHVLSTGLDTQKVRDDLEGKRSYQEFQMSRALQGNANDITIANIQRVINIIQAKIDRISQGEKPIATLMYIETTAIGLNEKDALDKLNEQIKAIQIALSTFDVDLTRIAGRELHTLFKFNFALPTTFAEVATHFDQQG